MDGSATPERTSESAEETLENAAVALAFDARLTGGRLGVGILTGAAVRGRG
jgi:hypothetical protein